MPDRQQQHPGDGTFQPAGDFLVEERHRLNSS